MTTFADLSAPFALLRLLAADHPDLPAVTVLISRHAPDRLSLEVHNDLAAFEAWRDVLNIAPELVRRNLHSADTGMTLTGNTTVADCQVEIVAYAPNLALLAEVAA